MMPKNFVVNFLVNFVDGSRPFDKVYDTVHDKVGFGRLLTLFLTLVLLAGSLSYWFIVGDLTPDAKRHQETGNCSS